MVGAAKSPAFFAGAKSAMIVPRVEGPVIIAAEGAMFISTERTMLIAAESSVFAAATEGPVLFPAAAAESSMLPSGCAEGSGALAAAEMPLPAGGAG